MNRTWLLALFIIAACARSTRQLPAHAAAPPLADPAPPATGELDRDHLVVTLIGGWVGEADTPFGTIPFALVFDREADASVHSHVVSPDGGYLDLRFHRDGAAWLLTEEGELAGLGVQRHTLVPAAGAPAAHWVDRDDPRFLDVAIAVDPAALRLAVKLRGRDHVAFRLRRLPADQVAALRQRLGGAAGNPARVSSP